MPSKSLPKPIRTLPLVYAGIVVAISAIIVVLHLMEEAQSDFLSLLRVPLLLREMGPVLGLTWPTSLDIYHVFLLLFFWVFIFNAVGLYYFHYRYWRFMVKFSSFVGLFVIWTAFLFFFFPLTLSLPLGPDQIMACFLFSIFLLGFLALDLLTFFSVMRYYNLPGPNLPK